MQKALQSVNVPASVVAAPSHTYDLFTTSLFPGIVDRCVRAIKKLKKQHRINALASSGHSGLPLMGALAVRLKMPMLAVRKTKDTDNDWHMVNGELIADGKYLIIDDLISTGDTVRRIHLEITTASKDRLKTRPMTPMGILLWYSARDTKYVLGDKVSVPVFDLHKFK